MRDEKQMMDMILSAAQADPRIRAVLLCGSRANPNAPRDIFQDYDIVYLVREMESFYQDGCYVDRFGPRIMLQMPESMREPIGDGRLTCLALLADGNRLDLQIVPLARWEQMLGRDSQTILLLDKDGCLPAFPPSSDEDYLPTPPDGKDYFSCCNNVCKTWPRAFGGMSCPTPWTCITGMCGTS